MTPAKRFTMLEQRCPLCQSRLLTDGAKKWCSFLGTATYPACTYGRESRGPFDAARDK